MGRIAAIVAILSTVILYCSTFPVVADTSAGKVPDTPATEDSVSPDSFSETMSDIIDIKAPEAIGFDKRMIYYGLAALLALLVIGLIIVLLDYYFRRRKQKTIEDTIVISPEDEASKKLEELRLSDLNNPREFYFILTAILRHYMGRRYDIDAPEMTTEELIPVIGGLSVETKLKSELRDFLKSTEPVKFAAMGAESEQMDSDFRFVEEFVKVTTPDVDNIQNEKQR